MLKIAPLFVTQYWAGSDLRRAVQDFVDCEPTETVSAFKLELSGIANAVHPIERLEQLLGVNIKVKYGSYEQWAKTVLLMLASTRNV